jgi:hypothetical protein
MKGNAMIEKITGETKTGVLIEQILRNSNMLLDIKQSKPA